MVEKFNNMLKQYSTPSYGVIIAFTIFIFLCLFSAIFGWWYNGIRTKTFDINALTALLTVCFASGIVFIYKLSKLYVDTNYDGIPDEDESVSSNEDQSDDVSSTGNSVVTIAKAVVKGVKQ